MVKPQGTDMKMPEPAHACTAMPSPESSQDVVELIKAWLHDEANVAALSQAFNDADAQVRELNERSVLPMDGPARMTLGGKTLIGG